MTTHGSRLLPRPRPGQDGLRSMFNSRQSFVDCVSAGAGRHYLCLQWPGEAAAAARRDHCLLTSWILPRWLPLSQYCHQHFSHSKSLRRKILVPIILTVKKNQSVNKSFIISTNNHNFTLHSTYLNWCQRATNCSMRAFKCLSVSQHSMPKVCVPD